MEVKNITWTHPNFTYIIGRSNTGKTYFTNHLVKEALKKKFKVVYVVNSAFDVEDEIQELCEKNKNVYVVKCRDLKKPTIDFLTNAMKSDSRKIIIVDNFSYSLTLEFLDFTTFSRKYNASVVFIAHSLFSNKTISPRLRELVSYFILFYLPKNNNMKMILDDEMLKIYQRDIGFRTFKFLFIDQANSEYLVSKLPEYNFKIEWIEQKKKNNKNWDKFDNSQ